MTAHMSGGGGARWRGPRRPPPGRASGGRGHPRTSGPWGRGRRWGPRTRGARRRTRRVSSGSGGWECARCCCGWDTANPRDSHDMATERVSSGKKGNSDARRLGKIRENDERRERTSSRVRERRRGDSRANPTDVRPRRELCGSGPTSTRRSTRFGELAPNFFRNPFRSEGRTLFRSCEPNLGTHISFKKPNLLFLFGFLRHPNARRCCGAGQKRRHVAADLARLTRRHVRHRRRSPVGRRHRLRPPRARGASPSTRTRVFPRVPSTPRARRPREERLILSGPRVPIPGTLSPDPRFPSAPADRRPPRRPPRRRRRAQ